MTENFHDKLIKDWFDKTVDEAYNDEEFLTNIITFLLQFALHAAPKDETFSSVKAGQIAFYDEDPTKEIENGFPCLIEYLTKSDMGWCSWQYYNSVPDWEAKKVNGLFARHTLKSRFTGNKHARFQPEENSEGMNLYNKMTRWYGEFKAHEDFLTKARPMCNKLSKEMKLIPTWTAESGPKKSGKKRVDPGPDVEAPELNLSDTDEGVDSMCFQNALANGGSRFGRFNTSSHVDKD